MNYIRELNAFYDWLETNSVSLSAFALWHVLMHIANKGGWPDEFAVAVSVLCAKTGLSPRAVYDARNELKVKGRIEWWSRKGNQSAVYRLIPLSAINADKYADKELPAINAGNRAGNGADNHADKRADNRALLNKLNKTKQNNIPCSNEQGPGGDGDSQEKVTNAALIAELVKAYREILPPEKHQKGDYPFIGRLYNEYGYNTVLLAINELGYRVESGFVPDKPLVYLKTIVAKGGGENRTCKPVAPKNRQVAATSKWDWVNWDKILAN